MHKYLKRFLTMAAIFAITVSQASAYSGADAPSWASAAVTEACSRGFIDCTLQPNFSETLNRAVGYQMLTRAFGVLQPTTDSPFSDVESQWYESAADTAYTLGWTAGTSPGVFGGNVLFSRAQIATAMASVLGLSQESTSILAAYSDRNDIPAFAVGAVASMVSNGLMGQGGNSLFRPNDGVNKVEAIVIVNRAVSFAQTNGINVVNVAALRFGVAADMVRQALNSGQNIVNGELQVPQQQGSTPPPPPPPPAGTTITMTAVPFSFSPNTISARQNQPVTININSSGTHTFTINELDVNMPLQAGPNTFTFTPTITGSFQFYCAIPGHRQLGMVGTITVAP